MSNPNISNENNPNNSKNSFKNNSWPKQLYYYAILAGCILALAIGSFSFLRSNLVRYAFPESDYGYYPSYPNSDQCKYKDTYFSKPISEPNNPNTTAINSEEERKVCEKKLEDEKQKEISRRYQQEMLNSVLTLIIASLVLFGHLYTFKKIKNFEI